jgi:O-succinylbenzoic acid--CoA ligase
MTNPGPYLLNGAKYSQEELIAFCEARLRTSATPPWEQALCRFIRDYFDETVPLVQKTSGTTGDPTSIALQRPAMVRSAEMTLRRFNLLPGDRALLCLPVEYIAGKMMVVRALVGGLDLVTVEPSGNPLRKLENAAGTELKDQGSMEAAETELEDLESDEVAETELKDPESVEEEMEDLESESVKGEQEDSVSMKAVDFAAMVPLQLHETLKDVGSRTKLEKIGKLLIGGGEINPALREEVGKLRNAEVYESFAMSETYTHFAVRRISGERPDPYFRVFKGVKIGTDRRGCLVVDVPGVSNGAVVSNDLVRLGGDQEFEWLGRIDNVIKSGGGKIVPEILEKKIAELTGREVLVLGVPDSKLGQKLVLVVEEESLKADQPDSYDSRSTQPNAEPSAGNLSRPTRSDSNYFMSTIHQKDKQSADKLSDEIRQNGKQTAEKLTEAARKKESHSKINQPGKESVQTVFSKAILSKVLQKHELPKEIITIPSFPRNRSMKIDRNAAVHIITGKRIKNTN